MTLVHTPTLFLVLAAISALAAIAVFEESRRAPGRALNAWIAAYLCATALSTSSLFLFRLNETLAVLVPTLFAMTALALMHRGVALHLGRAPSALVFAPAAIWGALALLRWSGLPITETYVERRMVMCVIYVAYAFAVVRLLLRAQPRTKAIDGLVVVFALYGAFYLVRLVFLSPNLVPQEGRLEDFWITASIYKTILFVVATAYLFLTAWRERSEGVLREAAEVDSLTGMANRRAFRARAERLMRGERRAVLAVIDLDRFKIVNDTCGHAVGDEVLRQFATVLTSVAGRDDLCGHLGGEEFALWLEGETPKGASWRLREAANLFRLQVGKTCDLPFEATFSAGIAAKGGQGDLDALLRRADEALYRAKRGGRDRIETAAEVTAGAAPDDRGAFARR